MSEIEVSGEEPSELETTEEEMSEPGAMADTEIAELMCDDNVGLMADCEALIASKDALEGDTYWDLNWSLTVPVREWDGVGLDGIPQ